MFEDTKNHNLSSKDITKYQELYNLCQKSIKIYKSNPELFI